MIYGKDTTLALFSTPSVYFSHSLLLLAMIAATALHSKLGRMLFHFTSSVSWFPFFECIVHSIYTCPSSSSSYVFFLLREPRFTYSICLFISPMLRAHTKDLWQLKNYLFVFSGLIIPVAMIFAMESTCNYTGSRTEVGDGSSSSVNRGNNIASVYCELSELSAPYTQTYIKSYFSYVVAAIFTLIHLTYASATYCIAFKKGFFDTYFNFDIDSIDNVLAKATTDAERNSDAKNNLPADLKELSVEDAILLCEGKMSSRQKEELRLRNIKPKSTGER